MSDISKTQSSAGGLPVTDSEWRETKPGHWERKTGFMEKFYGKVHCPADGVPHWSIASVTAVEVAKADVLNIESIRNAWAALAAIHPSITSIFSGEIQTYEILDALSLNSWLEETFKVHRSSAGQFIPSLQRVDRPTLHYFPDTLEFLLHCNHQYMDGRGILRLWDQFYSLIIAPIKELPKTTIDRLPPRADDLLSISEILAPEDGQVLNDCMGQFGPPDDIKLPVRDVSARPLHSFRRALRLSTKTTAAVVDACKERNLSMTAAWHTAVILATQKTLEEAGKYGKTWCSISNFDLRPYFPAGFDSNEQVVACYHTGLPVTVVPEESTFHEIAMRLKEFYTGGIHHMRGALPSYAKALGDIFAQGIPPSSTPVVSSLGVLDNYLRKSFGKNSIQIKDVWIADTMRSAEVEAFLWTWDGHMVLSGSCNAAYYTHKDIDRFLTRIKDILLDHLGIIDA
ncbi:hypothetical protein BJX63DRAFT_434366 [Aspergillus granulosus]|uniref:Condensation domain-containing protein n=1 Tax=Aspergillus granulosus TaxID=176169 RepID=A0ABR4H4D2_9EURO